MINDFEFEDCGFESESGLIKVSNLHYFNVSANRQLERGGGG